MSTRVLIVDDHEAIRRGVRGILENSNSGVEIVGEAKNGDEAIEETRALRPDLVIMDVSMPILDGLSAAAEIKKRYSNTMILLFSAYGSHDIVKIAHELGLNGCVSKEEDGKGILKAVDAVTHHQTYFSPETFNQNPWTEEFH